jgi:pyroglutamyl-peptidase
MKSIKYCIFTGLIILLIISSTCTGFLNINQRIDDKEIKDSEKYIIVTGFEPFGNHKVNPSQFISENLSGVILNNASIIGITLPVDYSDSIHDLISLIEEYEPILIISLGLAANYNYIGLEKVSLNLKRIEKENWPYYRIIRINRDGPLFRFSELPCFNIVQEIKNEKIPARTSFYAGMYVCNALFYNLLGYINENNLRIKAGFIHVPLMDSQRPEGMALEDMISAIEIVIEQSLDFIYTKNFDIKFDCI